jgi:predicted DNA-binding WGR domain protein
MTKKFINQDGLSNKFWNVQTDGKKQTIVFGKIDTQGRETVKEFSSEAECLADTQKLISQKIKKGYIELKDGDAIPEKVELPDDEKAELFFWDVIKKSNHHRDAHWSEYDVDEHIEKLTELLAKSGKPKLISFEKVLWEKLDQLYTAEIAELAIILESEFKIENEKITFDTYLSDDGFIYFRCWLILKGQIFFDDITKNINHFLSEKYSFNIGDVWAEGLLYAADEAYAVNHENDDQSEIADAVSELYPNVMHFDAAERKMARQPLGGDELQKTYPTLVKTICELRSEPEES